MIPWLVFFSSSTLLMCRIARMALLADHGAQSQPSYSLIAYLDLSLEFFVRTKLQLTISLRRHLRALFSSPRSLYACL